ncbi:MAG: XRE family transcriptional regulator [Elusimicrobiota bacterium]
MDIPVRLRAIREAFGFTLQEVGESTGIGVSSLSEFENGKREPSLSHLKKLAMLYEKPITFFLETSVTAAPTLLWRKKPAEPKRAKLESKFTTLCKQYKNLEIWTKAPKAIAFNKLFVEAFPENYQQVRLLAHETSKQMDLGARPGESLFRVLEEVYGVKIFHLPLGDDASSACFYTEEFGPAIMLNNDSKQWRRNFDLAHELFHLITWKVRAASNEGDLLSDKEESFADHFASMLLIPEQALRDAIEAALMPDNKISCDNLDAIARQFNVSLDALSWRLHYVYNTTPDAVRQMIEKTKNYSTLPSRQSENPPDLPSRYKALAVTALKQGEISSQQFANYLGISISEAYAYNIPGNSDAIQINTGIM